jgi:hypothetical protein
VLARLLYVHPWRSDQQPHGRCLKLCGAEGRRGSADGASAVTSPADLDRVLDAVADMDGPTLAELYTDGDPEKSWLEVGLNGDRGSLRYVGDDAPNGAHSKDGTFPLPAGGEVRDTCRAQQPVRRHPADQS